MILKSSQVKWTNQARQKNSALEKYLDMVRRMEASFERFSLKNIPRLDNEHADMLAKSAAQGLPLPPKYSLKY
jgi:ribonuclease HI